MPFTGYRVTSNYGSRKDPITGKEGVFHAGIDLVKNHKAPINAFTAGTVVYAGFGNAGTGLGGYGNVVLIKDAKGYGQLYAHLDSVAVKTGDKVSKGQVIGYQGATGQVTGSHLHFEVRKSVLPSYGWTSNKSISTVDPTKHLQSLETVTNQSVDTNVSIVDYLNSQKIDSSFKNREKLAVQYGIKNYKGTEKQNLELLNKMKLGSAATIFKDGQKVKVKSSAQKYTTGQNIPSWAKGKSYTIQQVKDDKVLLKEIVSWVFKTDVE